MTENPYLAILMATYNGEKYLQEQIDSIKAQTYSRWKLYIRDDGSTDATLAIIERNVAEDARIVSVSGGEHKGAKHNFLELLRLVEADYYMFSDQDDVWLPHKIAHTLECLQNKERENASKPIAVHTDLRVVDRNLEEISPSLWQMFRTEPSLIRNLDELGGHCLMTGCTMMFNRMARDLAGREVPAEVLMHDLWLTIVVFQAGGAVSEVREATILYRQHANNTLGTADYRNHFVINKLCALPRVLKETINYYKMLKSVGYGSFCKFFYQKIAYNVRYRRYRKEHKQ